MRILIVGNGGREHALLHKLRQDAPSAEFFITRGNGGTAPLATSIPLSSGETQPLAGWALKERIDLTVVGPEIPLADGIVDHFTSQGLPIFGPTGAAAEIESSKAFAKRLMADHGIPTAAFQVFTDVAAATAYVRSLGAPVVVKASGLAAGKGAVVCMTEEEAISTIEEMLGGALGPAGSQVVVEEFMEGEELSVFAICDGDNHLVLLPAQDHKRIGEGDTGPNTGGMGAYAPVTIATPALMDRIGREVLAPTLRAMRREGRPFRGFLYAGLMITATGPRVVEFNCRFGDPEAQVVLPMLRSPLLPILMEVASGGKIDPTETLDWRPGAAVTTVLASGGYPGEYRTGLSISVPAELSAREDVIVFHAGTAIKDGQLVTAGGRVLTVTGFGETVEEAARRSREAAATIEFEGRTFRHDIAWREVERSSSTSSS